MTIRNLPGEPPVEITLRRSRRARRFSLRVSHLDGRVTLSLPAKAREAEALAFAEGQADWIRAAMARAAPAVAVGWGSDLPFDGRMLRIVPHAGRGVVAEAERLLVPGCPEDVAARVRGFLRVAARARLAAACDRYAAVLGRSYRALTLRDPRSRWGSCSAQGGLMFSWRLIMAPPEVLDYVAAHEVAHLAEMNHAPAFWRVVERLRPGHEQQRRWLRRHGSELHRYRFGD